MLDLASPPVLQLERTDTSDAVEEVLALVGPQLSHRKITFQKVYDPAAPAVMADRNRLKTALLNVVMNASEAMTTGGALEIGVRKEDRWVLIEVRDNGVGIDPSIRDQLFSPFVTTKREGVGLGLLNTKNILEQHGGTIELLPAPERGTRALMRLPIALD
jgi:signal transduction histidine kinase